MIALVLLSLLVSGCLAQYPYNPNQYQQQQQQPQNQQGSNSGAPLHYVSIGPQLQGDYKFGYNTGNDGSFREEVRNPDGSVSGSYGYIDASGKQKVIKYTAGKDGFKAEGEDIPKAPAAPQPAAPVAPQPAQYQPQHNSGHYQPQQHQSGQYQSQHNSGQYQPQYNSGQYQPQQHQSGQYQPEQYSNNYVQPQASQGYNQYAQPQQQAATYNPFAYHNPAPGQTYNPASQFSYSIGAGQPNQYQG